jgi:hypothetical protein
VNEPLECQHRIAQRLEKQLALHPMERGELVKRILVSPKQLQALFTGDPEQFHTYGIYLRALTRAVALLGLSEHAQTKQDLETLEQFYAQSPRGSDIRKVRDTVNRMLGEAPAEPSEQMPSKRILVVMLVVCFVVLGSVAIALSY